MFSRVKVPTVYTKRNPYLNSVLSDSKTRVKVSVIISSWEVGDASEITQGQGDIHISLLLLYWYNYCLYFPSFLKVSSIENCTPSRQFFKLCFPKDLDSIYPSEIVIHLVWYGVDLHFKNGRWVILCCQLCYPA